MNKVIDLKKYQKSQKNPKMFFLTIFIGAFLGFVLWHYFVENIAALDVQIPQSRNITFNNQQVLPMTTAQIASEFDKAEGKPILLYVYTTWCATCRKNFPIINEIAREFQNSDLTVLALAIDRGIDGEELRRHLNEYGNVYFQMRFLSFKDGFIEFLKKKNISYSNRIPFTVLLNRHGEVITKFNGRKSKNYLRNKIIKQFADQ